MSAETTSTESGVAGAEERCRLRLAEQPDDTSALHELARICASEGRFEEALEQLSRLIELEPDNLEARLMASGLAGNAGNTDAAEQGFREVLARRQDSAPAHLGLAQVALDRKQSEAAEEHFRRALKHEPNMLDALIGLGTDLLVRGKPAEARKLLEHAAEVAPRNPMVLLRQAQARIAAGEPLAAGRPLTRALEIDPGFAPARMMLAQIDLRRDRAAEAEQGFRTVRERHPELASDATGGLADALKAQGRAEEALAMYEESFRERPDSENLATARADTLALLGRVAEARAALERFLDEHPKTAAPRLLLADLLDAAGESDAALGMWRVACDPAKVGPAVADVARLQLGLRLEQAGDHAGAAAAATAITASDPRAAIFRARCAVRAGNHDVALRELLPIDPAKLPAGGASERYRLLGLAHDAGGRYREAVLAFREAGRGAAAPALPSLMPAEDIRPLLDEVAGPALEADQTPPILLAGLPGSGVELVAALLADQADIRVREDRFAGQTDLLGAGNDPRMRRRLDLPELELMAGRYRRGLRRTAMEPGGQVVEILPVLDARVLGQLQRVLPGTRLLWIDRDTQASLLDWLAFGWHRGFRFDDPIHGARWSRLAHGQLQLAAEVLETYRVDADSLFAELEAGGGPVVQGLADWLGIEKLVPGDGFRARHASPSGLPMRFPRGHAAQYREALAPAFAVLGGGAAES